MTWLHPAARAEPEICLSLCYGPRPGLQVDSVGIMSSRIWSINWQIT